MSRTKIILCVGARVIIVRDKRVHRAVVKSYVVRDDGTCINMFNAKSEEDGSVLQEVLVCEDITWARGWSSRAAKALRVACVL